jgi:hypothetical protein
MAGRLTYETTLSYSENGTTYTSLACLMEVPEMGGDVDKVEVTTLGDECKKYINGLKDFGDLQFKFLYDAGETNSSFEKLKEIEDGGTLGKYKVTYPDGTYCTFDAYVHVKVDSASVGAVMTFTASFVLQTDLTWQVLP